MALMTQPIIDLLHKVDSPKQKIMLFTVPMRMIRVVATDSESFKTFRVEQLLLTSKDVHNPRGSWNTLSTHGSETPGASYQDAVEAALKAQVNLRNKLQQRAQARRPQLLVPA